MDTTGAGVGGRVAAASVESVAAGGIEAGNGASDGYRRVASLWHTLLVVVVQGVLSYRAAVSFGKSACSGGWQSRRSLSAHHGDGVGDARRGAHRRMVAWLVATSRC